MRRDITVPLKPCQFNALVSFLYNPGHGWPVEMPSTTATIRLQPW